MGVKTPFYEDNYLDFNVVETRLHTNAPYHREKMKRQIELDLELDIPSLIGIPKYLKVITLLFLISN